jgi:ribonuclease HI
VIDRDRIESVVKSSIGSVVSIEQEDDVWRCRLNVPRNVEARLNSLKKTFPGLRLVNQEGSAIECLIPMRKNRRRSPQSRIVISDTNTPTADHEDLLRRLAELYETFFEDTGEVMRIDDQHYKLTFGGDLVFPFHHPFMALLSALSPDLTPVAITTEHLGGQKRTAIYLSTKDERPKTPAAGVSVFIDGSYREGIAAYGVCYSMAGQPSAYLVGAVNGLDSNGAELMAFLQALAHLDDTAHDVVIYTDSTFVTEWASDGGQPWVDRAKARHIGVRVQLIKRDDNGAAHALANKFLSRLFA